MKDVPLDEAYFLWLCSQVGLVENRDRSKTYWTLLKLLHLKEFTWTNIEMDGNRAQDGRDLRREFLNETGTVVDESDWLAYGCSMLEMMVALSFKLAFEGGGVLSDWFWVLVDNLGLTECTDAHPPEEIIVDHILNKFINRDYAPNGAGGLFPLSDANADQRDVQLWYQAQAYLLERL